MGTNNMLKVTETIVQFSVSEKSKENAWRDLVNEVKTTPLHEVTEHLTQGEIEYMEQYHSEDPAAKTKKGRWKTSKYLPNAYKSAKSVITRAIRNGVELTDTNGNPRGKSEVEKNIPKGGKVILITEEIDKHVRALETIANAGFEMDVIAAVNTLLHEQE